MAHAVDLIKSVEVLKDNIPTLKVGDTVKVHVRIVEGKNERIQVFQGTIIAMGGNGANRSILVRRIAANGIGVERKFLIHSPRVDKVQVLRHAHVRRAKLYFLRDRSGKAARLKEKRVYHRKTK
ncbi:MAG: 50S ribosomal protein L19 [Anaerolineaceae bacterium 4572_78]|nr:MAG: 50S ribosomal protein L19 [Anaerolineaceae bacterium 4572_78]